MILSHIYQGIGVLIVDNQVLHAQIIEEYLIAVLVYQQSFQ